MSRGDNIEVGTKLFFVSNAHGHRSPRKEWWTVEKIGRKWITLNGRYRADKETLEIDAGGYCSPGGLWLSEEEYEVDMRRRKFWRRLNEKLRDWSWNPPVHLTEAKIIQIAEIAGIKLDDAP